MWVFSTSFAYFAVQYFHIFEIVSQFDLFPERVTVEPVDARSAAGERSHVKAMFVVQFERKPGKHQQTDTQDTGSLTWGRSAVRRST